MSGGDAAAVAAVLAEHERCHAEYDGHGWRTFTCGARLHNTGGPTEAHRAHVAAVLAAHVEAAVATAVEEALAQRTPPYDDRLITCPECTTTFEAEDGSVVHMIRAALPAPAETQERG